MAALYLRRRPAEADASGLPGNGGAANQDAAHDMAFPDINVWVALTLEGHVHHTTAATWFTELPPEVRLAFWPFTPLGLLRLLTAAVVMGDEVMTQPQAWETSSVRPTPPSGGNRSVVPTT
jgi:hypothetical protein